MADGTTVCADPEQVEACEDSEDGFCTVEGRAGFCASEGLANPEEKVCLFGCGDRLIDDDIEECDGTNFGRADCEDFQFYGGELVCTEDCTIDLSSCEGSCGDGAVDIPIELCDPEAAIGVDCVAFGFERGVPTCAADCQGYSRVCDMIQPSPLKGLAAIADVTFVTSPEPGSLVAVSALSAAFDNQLVTFEGADWEPMYGSPGNTTRLFFVSQTLGYAVDSYSTVHRWDGDKWTELAQQPPEATVIQDLWAPDSTSIFVAGAFTNVVHRFDGNTWSDLTDPRMAGGFGAQHIAGRGVDDVYVHTLPGIGQHGLWHLSGQTWTELAVPAEAVVSLRAHHGEVYWTTADGIYLAEPQGLSTLAAAPPSGPILVSWVDAAGNLWAKTSTSLARFDGNMWVEVSTPSAGNVSLTGWDPWTVFYTSDQELNMYSGSHITRHPSPPTDGRFKEPVALADGEVYVAQDTTGQLTEFSLRRWDGSAWTIVCPIATCGVIAQLAARGSELTAITRNAPLTHVATYQNGAMIPLVEVPGEQWTDLAWIDDTAYLIAQSGALFRFDETGLHDESLPATGLAGIAGSATTNVWVVSKEPKVYHFDGVAWQEVAFQGENALQAVWTSPSGTPYIGGADGFYRREGDGWEKLSDTTVYEFADTGEGSLLIRGPGPTLFFFDGKAVGRLDHGNYATAYSAIAAGPSRLTLVGQQGGDPHTDFIHLSVPWTCAAAEVCGDLVDNDCNGHIDARDPACP
jgi:hypothetical protein